MGSLLRVALFASTIPVGALVSTSCGTEDGGSNVATQSSSTSTTHASGGSGGAGGGSGGVTSSATTSSAAGGAVIVEVACQGHVYACGNTLDDDGDGLIDAQDPECLGPCDNSEDSYWNNISGDTGAKCIVDCYFDQDSGAGNDQCYWNHACDPHEAAPDWYPEAPNGDACAYDPSSNTPGTSATCDELYDAQLPECIDFCGPLTPNGCDCFGCCELPAGSGKWIWLASDSDTVPSNGGSCTKDVVDDPTKCQPCLPVAACLNTCDHCEICVGKPVLPADCGPGTGGAGGGGADPCAPGVQFCDPNDPSVALCPAGYYCITGCCQPPPPK